ncbi:NAD-dependent epimerase/dehydratase family protein [Haloferula sp.]|uniref:NAD-dependent epimerase/dehydratase family protein n=1 Tax=Haloferula sp. TaxID=2497595 RepID=UPI00329C5E81
MRRMRLKTELTEPSRKDETMGRKALIAGATGAIGSVLIELLNRSDQYSEIHCIGRREPPISGEKIKSHIISYDELDQLSLPQPIDDVFCAIGTTIKTAGSVERFKKVDRDYVFQVGKLAQRLKARTCSVVSAIGAKADSSNYYNQTKGEAEELLQSLGLRSLRIFRPSMLHGTRDELRMKEAIGFAVLTIMTPVLQGPWKKYRAISIAQVAKAMHESALQVYPAIQVFESDKIQNFLRHASSTKPTFRSTS